MGAGLEKRRFGATPEPCNVYIQADDHYALDVVQQIADGLARDAKVQIQGFGTFQTKHRKERMGINPQTKEPMQIPASKTVGFKPGQDLKKRV